MPVGGEEKLTILIIDDDDLIVEAAADYLIRHGYDIHTERQFHAAKSLMLQCCFDLVLMDLYLTGGSVLEGREMVRWVREHFPSVEIGIFTGSANRMEETARNLGVSLFLKKPITVREVLTAVNAVSASRVGSSGSLRSGERV